MQGQPLEGERLQGREGRQGIGEGLGNKVHFPELEVDDQIVGVLIPEKDLQPLERIFRGIELKIERPEEALAGLPEEALFGQDGQDLI